MESAKKITLWIGFIALALFAILFVLKPLSNSPTGSTVLEDSTFSDTGDPVITDQEGKPYVILFSTTWCSHCQWISGTFDSLADEDFADKINLQHWELDTKDNTLTPETETEIPQEIMNIYNKYDSNGYVPAFVFGGKYIRIGNGYEGKNDLNAEKDDFEFIINKLLE